MTLLQLLWTFFYIGLFTIGGGLVAITLMYKPIVESGILSSEMFYNMVAISESTPGPIGINMATYIGYELYGIAGGVITTIGTVLPSLIVIIFIAKRFDKMQGNRYMKAAFAGIRPAASGMIAVAAAQALQITVISLPTLHESGIWYEAFNIRNCIFYAAALLVVFRTKLHPIFVIAAGAVFGVFFL